MPSLNAQARRMARGFQRRFWPSPEGAILQRLEREAFRAPRYTHGRVAAGPYRVEYADAMSVWPQWDEIFMHDALAFDTATPTPRILDCGANVGVASMYFKRRYPRAKVTAFEADPLLAEICRRNLAANAAGDVDVQAAAVWTSDGDIEFICEGSDSGAVASLDLSINGRKTVVPAVRLRDRMHEPIDLLKIDIEGAELPVLEDCRDALRHVRSMVIDLHEFDPARRQTGPLFDLLATAGFAFDMRSLAPLPWRAPQTRSPFPDSAPVWAVTVRAWRP